jgi:hypothetical protein
LPLNLSELGGSITCQKDAFLCAAKGTEVTITLNKKLGAGFFGGEGFILQKLKGDGLAFLHAGGTIVKKKLNGEKLRIDTGCIVGFTGNIDYRFGNDIKDNKAIIICGRQNGTGKVGQEGKRLASITGTTLKFLKKEGALSYPNKCMYNCTKSCEGIVLPANVWYVRINGGTYWLYRNEEKVIPNVEDFQVFVGYDLNGDGVVEDSELKKTDSLPGDAVPENLRFFLFKIKAAYYWKNEKYQLNSAIRVETFH